MIAGPGVITKPVQIGVIKVKTKVGIGSRFYRICAQRNKIEKIYDKEQTLFSKCPNFLNR